MKKFIILTTLSLILNLNLQAQNNRSNNNNKKKIKIISNAAEAREFAHGIGSKMYQLAEAFQSRESSACELYKSLQYSLTHTTVKGNFQDSARLQYRINWYKDPEVDLYKICIPNFYSDVEYKFLMVHAKSMSNMQFD